MNRAVKIIVSGKVQGVYFRAATKKQADKRGIVGYAKNLADGRVEIKAVADKTAIDELISWSHKGSLFAKVKQVEITDLQTDVSFNEFSIK
jgi:acylphosphatase